MSTSLDKASDFKSAFGEIDSGGFFNGFAVEFKTFENGEISGFILRASGCIPINPKNMPAEAYRKLVDPEDMINKLLKLVQNRKVAGFDTSVERLPWRSNRRGESRASRGMLIQMRVQCDFHE